MQNLKKSNQEIADQMWKDYGPSARMVVAISAEEALRLNDIAACRMWREILEILEAKL